MELENEAKEKHAMQERAEKALIAQRNRDLSNKDQPYAGKIFP
jgi:hypothetical protein